MTLMCLLSIVVAAVLTASEAAFSYLPRQEAEDLMSRRGGKSLRRVLADPVAHLHALRFWRIWFEMAGAVAVAILLHDLLDNVWLAGLLATVAMAAVGFVLVGVSPRQLGRVRSTPIVRSTSWLVRVLRLVLGPVPRWLVALGNTVTPGETTSEVFFTEEQFRELVTRASEADMLEDSEAELIHSVFELGDTKVRSVMVPRMDVVSIDADATLRQAMSLFLRSGYSRIPVIGDSADQVLGVMYLKDAAATMHGHNDDDAMPVAADLCRSVRYVPESKAVADLLSELQHESTHVAIVVDEYGGTAGLVTLEDLIEEIVGEIVDEYDTEAPEVEDLGDGKYRVSARMSVADLGEIFDRELDDDEVDTVGGLLSKALGRVPIVGSEAQVQSIVLRAERTEGRRNRISHIIVFQPEPAPAHADEQPGRHNEPVNAS
nr:hemolysin family protein [Arthrobacter castelli]